MVGLRDSKNKDLVQQMALGDFDENFYKQLTKGEQNIFMLDHVFNYFRSNPVHKEELNFQRNFADLIDHVELGHSKLSNVKKKIKTAFLTEFSYDDYEIHRYKTFPKSTFKLLTQYNALNSIRLTMKTFNDLDKSFKNCVNNKQLDIKLVQDISNYAKNNPLDFKVVNYQIDQIDLISYNNKNEYLDRLKKHLNFYVIMQNRKTKDQFSIFAEVITIDDICTNEQINPLVDMQSLPNNLTTIDILTSYELLFNVERELVYFNSFDYRTTQTTKNLNEITDK